MRPIASTLALLLCACSCAAPLASPPPSQPPDAGVSEPIDEAPLDEGGIASDTAPPVEGGSGTSRCSTPRPGSGYECKQGCGPPVVSTNDPPPRWYWMSPAQLDSRRKYGCPICLPAWARIATPKGEVVVTDLVAGDTIWTLDAREQRLAGSVVYVGSTPAPPGHRMVRVVLADGRRVAASARHPTHGHGPIADLGVGDAFDGSRVMRVEVVKYDGTRTFDVLPSGPTRAYWADGVLLESTLRSR